MLKFIKYSNRPDFAYYELDTGFGKPKKYAFTIEKGNLVLRKVRKWGYLGSRVLMPKNKAIERPPEKDHEFKRCPDLRQEIIAYIKSNMAEELS